MFVTTFLFIVTLREWTISVQPTLANNCVQSYLVTFYSEVVKRFKNSSASAQRINALRKKECMRSVLMAFAPIYNHITKTIFILYKVLYKSPISAWVACENNRCKNYPDYSRCLQIFMLKYIHPKISDQFLTLYLILN